MSDNGHLTQAMENMVKAHLKTKDFQTGSKGFFATGKLEVDGHRYQAQAQAVLIGSKGDAKSKVRATVDEAGAALAVLIRDGLAPKVFSSGNKGYRVQGKSEFGGQRYQASVQAVQIS